MYALNHLSNGLNNQRVKSIYSIANQATWPDHLTWKLAVLYSWPIMAFSSLYIINTQGRFALPGFFLAKKSGT